MPLGGKIIPNGPQGSNQRIFNGIGRYPKLCRDLGYRHPFIPAHLEDTPAAMRQTADRLCYKLLDLLQLQRVQGLFPILFLFR